MTRGRASDRLTLELDGAASHWKTPRAATTSADTPIANEFSTGDFAVGDTVEAMGRGPRGVREWFKATVTALRAPPAWPPITVKYNATLQGVTNRLALPEPVKAYLHVVDVRRIAN